MRYAELAKQFRDPHYEKLSDRQYQKLERKAQDIARKLHDKIESMTKITAFELRGLDQKDAYQIEDRIKKYLEGHLEKQLDRYSFEFADMKDFYQESYRNHPIVSSLRSMGRA